MRGYAQRTAALRKSEICEVVPARLEPTLEFALRDPFQVEFTNGSQLTTPQVSLIGPQTSLRAIVRLTGTIESFAIFFHPTGFTQLFGIPFRTLVNDALDGYSAISNGLRKLRDRLGETGSFAERLNVVEETLFARAMGVREMGRVAEYIFGCNGVINVTNLAYEANMSIRNFERRFVQEFGLPPKIRPHYAFPDGTGFESRKPRKNMARGRSLL